MYAPGYVQSRRTDAVVLAIASSAGSSPTSTSTACAQNLCHSNANTLTLRIVHVRLLCTPPASVPPTRAQPCVQQPHAGHESPTSYCIAMRLSSKRSYHIQHSVPANTRIEGWAHGQPHPRSPTQTGRTPILRAAGEANSPQAARCQGPHLRRLIRHRRTVMQKLFPATLLSRRKIPSPISTSMI